MRMYRSRRVGLSTGTARGDATFGVGYRYCGHCGSKNHNCTKFLSPNFLLPVLSLLPPPSCPFPLFSPPFPSYRHPTFLFPTFSPFLRLFPSPWDARLDPDKCAVRTGLAFGCTGLCSCRVRGGDGSCAKHLIVESYMVIYAPNSYTYYY